MVENQDALLSKTLEESKEDPVLAMFALIIVGFIIVMAVITYITQIAWAYCMLLVGIRLSYIMIIIAFLRSLRYVCNNKATKVLLGILSFIPILNIIMSVVTYYKLSKITKKEESPTIQYT